ASGAARQAVVTPLAPDRYKVQVTVSRETADKLRHTQDLMRHTIPDGDLSIIIDRALTLLLSQLERQKLAAVTTPRPGRVPATRSRHIPAAVRRAVWTRDQGQCAFVGTAGRCTERGRLEFHHVVPYARGGTATVGTIALRCRAHNQHEAELEFGPGAVRRREPHPLAAGSADARGTGPAVHAAVVPGRPARLVVAAAEGRRMMRSPRLGVHTTPRHRPSSHVHHRTDGRGGPACAQSEAAPSAEALRAVRERRRIRGQRIRGSR